MLDPIYEAIAWLLAQFYGLVPNLGVAIILLTFTIMLILYPLTAKQAKSMIAMQRVQPEIKKLQAKYKNDRQKLNEEVMKFYQENKINPLSGCLPLLVQMPIFFSLFHVLRNTYQYVPKSSALYQALCQGFGKSCGADLTRKLQETIPAGQLKGLNLGDTVVHHLSFLTMDLQKSATDVSGGVFDAFPYFLLVVVVMVTGFMQSRQAQKRTPAANKQMAMVMKVLPVFFGLISLQFPAGLVLYFFVSNLWRLGQQEVIFRHHGSALTPGGTKTAIDVPSKERTAKGDAESPPLEELEEAPAEAPAPRQVAKRASAPKQGAAAGTEPRRASGGLRGLFQLPPPDANGGAAGGSRAPATKTSRPSGGAPPKPPPQRKRNKKKRKR